MTHKTFSFKFSYMGSGTKGFIPRLPVTFMIYMLSFSQETNLLIICIQVYMLRGMSRNSRIFAHTCSLLTLAFHDLIFFMVMIISICSTVLCFMHIAILVLFRIIVLAIPTLNTLKNSVFNQAEHKWTKF